MYSFNIAELRSTSPTIKPHFLLCLYQTKGTVTTTDYNRPTHCNSKLPRKRTRRMAIGLSPTEPASVSAISLRHILASPGYAPGTIAVNVTWMERGFNACQTHCSLSSSIFNRFPVIQPVSTNDRHISTFFAHFGLHWVRLWDNRGNCHMDENRIQWWSNASQHTHLSSIVYELYRDSGRKLQFFPTPCI